MSDFVDYTASARSSRRMRWLWLISAGLVLAGCLFWTGLFLYLPVLPQIWANHLDRVQGKAELLAPAQSRFNRAELSPDGRRLALFATTDRDNAEAPFVWDLATGECLSLNLHISDLRWLNTKHFAVYDTTDNYYVIDGRDLSMTYLKVFPNQSFQKPRGFGVIEPMLRAADHVYILETFGEAGYQVIALRQKQSYFFKLGYGYQLGLTREELKSLFAHTPHTNVPQYGWSGWLGTGDKVISPDSRFYVTTEVARAADVNERVAIYTRAGELVAEAYKAGWQPYILGWAHDGGGVYFKMRISGDAANVLVPYQPIFKLSPLTPEEARWALAKTIAIWAALIGVPVGMGWWLWRRRRARRSIQGAT